MAIAIQNLHCRETTGGIYMMKKTITMMLAAIMMLSVVGIATTQTSKYDVTQPITITWWHAHEDQWNQYLNYMVEQFHKQNPLITVKPVYIGAYAEINTQLIAAVASGDVPALCTANTSYPASYGAAGICEILDPYIKAYGFDIADFGEGLIASTSYEGKQICLPYLISTQVMYYNKTMADAEGITMPKTFNEMEAFLKKATIFNKDGSTARYGAVFGGWDYWYYEMLYKNNGVEVVCKDGLTTDVNSKISVEITSKIKEWIDKGYAYYAYGTGASANMRQLFWDGGAFSVFHTSSLYDTYVQQTKGAFEVGMAWLPGGMDGKSFKSEVGGAAILIPAVASQRQKNAAWQFMMFMASPEINLYWADKTGYFPTRQSVIGTREYEKYLERKPAMSNVVSMSSWINPRNQHPAYDTVANEWRHALARIFNEGAPVKATLDDLAKTITEILEDF
ncbi:MAG TPA: ABC transporter substrate-binding protein [Firmicutes bacterium]|jgi:multiple sugar transport system substrate-binding protein|nr:ABC transporter substrate-binding protein [Bacillota bacterium]